MLITNLFDNNDKYEPLEILVGGKLLQLAFKLRAPDSLVSKFLLVSSFLPDDLLTRIGRNRFQFSGNGGFCK